jgi:hypothetical protein
MNYSARDVEDLTEVNNKMEDQLKNFIDDMNLIEKFSNKNL